MEITRHEDGSLVVPVVVEGGPAAGSDAVEEFVVEVATASGGAPALAHHRRILRRANVARGQPSARLDGE